MMLRQGTTKESPLQASKWLESQLLIDGDEMAALLDHLGPFFLFACGSVCRAGKGEISKDEFLRHYRAYIELLKNGVEPEASFYRSLFSPALTVTTDSLFSLPLSDEREIIRVSKPVIQLQAHYMSYSTVDKKFHSMVFGSDSISWGIQFSYPQLYRDDQTKIVEAVKESPAFPNTHVFHALQKWVRQNTIPTPFHVKTAVGDESVVNVPMRLGKKCLSWINRHPHLIKKGISVKC